jgi:lipid-A-disaccharide synthase
MLIAGEPSGDLLAAELVSAMTAAAPGRQLRCFGAGGPQMAAAGVDVVLDLTRHSMIGLAEALTRYRTFKRLFDQLLDLAFERRPDVIVCVDFSGFNSRFARAVRSRLRSHHRPEWTPKIVQYVSPQVWASRPGRAHAMARDLDLLLAIFPFEKAWYAERVPELRVEFVGHPILDRHAAAGNGSPAAHPPNSALETTHTRPPDIVLLPGSRLGEVRRHLPVMLAAVPLIRESLPETRFRIVAPTDSLKQVADALGARARGVELQVGGLANALTRADLAIASTGTVTMECAFFGVPAVAMYRTSWLTYQLGRRIVTVQHLAMPNLLADDALFPELIQHDATPERVAREALALLNDRPRRAAIRRRLGEVIASLGGPGANRRAAGAILSL